MNWLAIGTGFGTCALAWEGGEVAGFRLPDAAAGGVPGLEAPPAWVEALAGRVRQHLSGVPQDFSALPYAWSRVTEFQRAVYERTLAVPAGRTCSYGAIAEDLGLGPAGARAVGVALGANPWPLLIPCHRVVSASAKMTGFSAPGGIRTKTRLLALEGAELLSE